MRSIILDVPTFGFVVATRAMLGVGIGLALAERIPDSRRKTAATLLIAAGALTTIPAVRAIRRSRRAVRRNRTGVQQDSRLIGVSRYPRKGDDLV